jgi:MFS family permease
MEGQQYSTAVDAEELRASSLSDQNSEKLSQAEIERLGRQRPAIFSTTLVEFGFVTCIVLSLMMSEYFTSGFNIILPSLAPAIGLPKAARTWPAAVPNLAAAAFLLPFARLCAQLGARQIFLYGHLWLLVWSGLNGFASNYILIILCRAMQGIGFAAFLPAGLALLGQIYRPGPRKNLVYCIYGAFACVGFYFGIFVAALTAEFVNWRWYFYIGSILQLALLGLGFMVVPRNLNDSSDDARMDWWGLATIVPGIALVSYVLTDANHAPQGWKTPYVYICLIAGFLFLGAAVYVQKKVSSQPLVPVHVLRIKYMLRLSVGLFCYFGLFSIFMFYSSL